MEIPINAQLLSALELAYSEIFRLITTSRMIQETHTHDSGDVLKTIAAAIAAANGGWRNEINVQSTEFESSGVLSGGDELILPRRGK